MATDARSSEQAPISFTAALSTLDDTTLVRLPEDVSERLPSRGQVAVTGTIDDQPLWRLIAIAVVGIGAIIVGLVGRLQAPFLIGVIVTVVHGITTFSPQIRELYEGGGWLVWIIVGAIGGTLLTMLAARYEKSLSSARTTIRRVTDLR